MDAVFLKLFNMSITASWLILAVFVLRLLLKKASKKVYYILWALVAIRLCCPVSFVSVFSLIPSSETLNPDLIYSDTPSISSGISVLNSTVNPVLSQALAPGNASSTNPMHNIITIASILWIMGILILLTYEAISYLNLRRKVSAAMYLQDHLWLCDEIQTPFILGILSPRIYLPSYLDNVQRTHAIAHENAHLAHHDHWWKPIGFLLLSIHWFNPLCWIAYLLLCKDIELACDERVIKDFDLNEKKAYSNSLLSCSISHRMIESCPLSFGDVGVKERVKHVLNYKKPAFWIMILAAISCAGLILFLMTNPRKSSNSSSQSGPACVDTIPAPIGLTDEPKVMKYTHQTAIEWETPSILLTEGDHTFTFVYSLFSSYIAYGTYELTDTTLTLRTKDGLYVYVFQVDGTTLIFDAANSSSIPQYRYSSDGNPQSPVPDQAVFTLQNEPAAFNISNYDAYGSTTEDIDHDGIEETCSLGYGPTSGVFSFTITASVDDVIEYQTVFLSDFYYLSFDQDEDGNLVVCAKSTKNGPVSHMFDVSVEDDQIVLTENSEPLKTLQPYQ